MVPADPSQIRPPNLPRKSVIYKIAARAANSSTLEDYQDGWSRTG